MNQLVFLRPTELHIPDGLLSLPVALFFWLISVLMVSIAARRAQNSLAERQIPLMGVMAAFIYAAQMINFPVAGGTSGHLLGGVLAAVALGPWPAMLVMTSVIVVQGLIFQDGGLLVMGANIFNMGLLAVLIGYGLSLPGAGRRRGLQLGLIAIAAWLSVMAAALATSLQLWLSGTARLDIVIPAMLGVHALIGLGEALITVAAVGFILRTRPDLITRQPSAKGSAGWVGVGLLLSLAVVLLAPLASTDPDGLERVAANLGLLGRGSAAPFRILPDYTIPGLMNTPVSTITAGAVGVLVLGGLMIALARALRRRA